MSTAATEPPDTSRIASPPSHHHQPPSSSSSGVSNHKHNNTAGARSSSFSSSSMPSPPEQHDASTVVVIDIVNFREIGRMLPPDTLAITLNSLIAAFESALDVYGLVGAGFIDGHFMAAATQPDTHADDAVRFGLHCISVADAVLVDAARPSSGTLAVRVAAHSGPIAAIRLVAAPWRPTLVGKTVVDVMRLLRHAQPNEVYCSRATVCGLAAELFNIVLLMSHSWTGTPSAKAGARVHAEKDHGPLGMLGGACFVCPLTLKLTFRGGTCMHASGNVPGALGFLYQELKHMRMLYGPRTDSQRIQAAVKTTFAMYRTTHVRTILYTRGGAEIELLLSFNFVPTSRQLVMTCRRPEPEDVGSSDADLIAILPASSNNNKAALAGGRGGGNHPPLSNDGSSHSSDSI